MDVFGRSARSRRSPSGSGSWNGSSARVGSRTTLPAFLLGGALGFVLAVAVTPRNRREGTEDQLAAARTLTTAWTQLTQTWQEMVESWTAAMERTRPIPDVDGEALSERLRALPGGEGATVRVLDSGIVEVTGDVAAEATVRALLDAVAGEEGVRVVLNRTWLRGATDHALDDDASMAERDSGGPA